MKGKLRIIILVLALAALSAGLPAALHAEDVTVVKGKVEYITGDTITVGGDNFYMTGIPIIDASGNDVPAYGINVGRKVAVFLSGGRIKSILVYDEHMVE
jgi:hypothetical protein